MNKLMFNDQFDNIYHYRLHHDVWSLYVHIYRNSKHSYSINFPIILHLISSTFSRICLV